MRGDHQLHERKLQRVLGAFRPAHQEEIVAVIEAEDAEKATRAADALGVDIVQNCEVTGFVFEAGRAALLVASLVVLATIVAVSVQLTGSLRSRVDGLARGAEAVARGDFTHRVEASADDELGMLGVAFNRMSARLADLVEQAVRMERLAVLGTFSTGVAHEVRNPLTGVLGFAQLMEIDHGEMRCYEGDYDYYLQKSGREAHGG